MIRPLRRQLSDEAVALMAKDEAEGRTNMPIHLFLVDETEAGEKGRTACGEGLGEWITGKTEQVTCKPCKEMMHA